MRFTVTLNGAAKPEVTANKASFTGLTPYTDYTVGITPNNGLTAGTTATLKVKTKGPTITITHGLGRNVTVTVATYTDALGTETNGLGTSSLGLGGSEPQALTPVSIAQGGTTVIVELPITWTPTGAAEKHADGMFYSITGNKTLRFQIS